MQEEEAWVQEAEEDKAEDKAVEDAAWVQGAEEDKGKDKAAEDAGAWVAL